ncbi:hypothetical protein L486_03273 [Kwoniella mangroviensis CBS 10435]|uniref:Uncharacterized protein n=1 Tax=Kwoniella mangroviensis CBS 10435 TaxID=1331196 RepID=A0A1B9ITC4_9TREE|nr:hypothetical protein L486_03273 [Kwoniella mangroviensis CBS 10435]
MANPDAAAREALTIVGVLGAIIAFSLFTWAYKRNKKSAKEKDKDKDDGKKDRKRSRDDDIKKDRDRERRDREKDRDDRKKKRDEEKRRKEDERKSNESPETPASTKFDPSKQSDSDSDDHGNGPGGGGSGSGGPEGGGTAVTPNYLNSSFKLTPDFTLNVRSSSDDQPYTVRYHGDFTPTPNTGGGRGGGGGGGGWYPGGGGTPLGGMMTFPQTASIPIEQSVAGPKPPFSPFILGTSKTPYGFMNQLENQPILRRPKTPIAVPKYKPYVDIPQPTLISSSSLSSSLESELVSPLTPVEVRTAFMPSEMEIDPFTYSSAKPAKSHFSAKDLHHDIDDLQDILQGQQKEGVDLRPRRLSELLGVPGLGESLGPGGDDRYNPTMFGDLARNKSDEGMVSPIRAGKNMKGMSPIDLTPIYIAEDGEKVKTLSPLKADSPEKIKEKAKRREKEKNGKTWDEVKGRYVSPRTVDLPTPLAEEAKKAKRRQREIDNALDDHERVKAKTKKEKEKIPISPETVRNRNRVKKMKKQRVKVIDRNTGKIRNEEILVTDLSSFETEKVSSPRKRRAKVSIRDSASEGEELYEKEKARKKKREKLRRKLKGKESEDEYITVDEDGKQIKNKKKRALISSDEEDERVRSKRKERKEGYYSDEEDVRPSRRKAKAKREKVRNGRGGVELDDEDEDEMLYEKYTDQTGRPRLRKIPHDDPYQDFYRKRSRAKAGNAAGGGIVDYEEDNELDRIQQGGQGRIRRQVRQPIYQDGDTIPLQNVGRDYQQSQSQVQQAIPDEPIMAQRRRVDQSVLEDEIARENPSLGRAEREELAKLRLQKMDVEHERDNFSTRGRKLGQDDSRVNEEEDENVLGRKKRDGRFNDIGNHHEEVTRPGLQTKAHHLQDELEERKVVEPGQRRVVKSSENAGEGMMAEEPLKQNEETVLGHSERIEKAQGVETMKVESPQLQVPVKPQGPNERNRKQFERRERRRVGLDDDESADERQRECDETGGPAHENARSRQEVFALPAEPIKARKPLTTKDVYDVHEESRPGGSDHHSRIDEAVLENDRLLQGSGHPRRGSATEEHNDSRSEQDGKPQVNVEREESPTLRHGTRVRQHDELASSPPAHARRTEIKVEEVEEDKQPRERQRPKPLALEAPHKAPRNAATADPSEELQTQHRSKESPDGSQPSPVRGSNTQDDEKAKRRAEVLAGAKREQRYETWEQIIAREVNSHKSVDPSDRVHVREKSMRKWMKRKDRMISENPRRGEEDLLIDVVQGVVKKYESKMQRETQSGSIPQDHQVRETTSRNHLMEAGEPLHRRQQARKESSPVRQEVHAQNDGRGDKRRRRERSMDDVATTREVLDLSDLTDEQVQEYKRTGKLPSRHMPRKTHDDTERAQPKTAKPALGHRAYRDDDDEDEDQPRMQLASTRPGPIPDEDADIGAPDGAHTAQKVTRKKAPLALSDKPEYLTEKEENNLRPTNDYKQDFSLYEDDPYEDAPVKSKTRPIVQSEKERPRPTIRDIVVDEKRGKERRDSGYVSDKGEKAGLELPEKPVPTKISIGNKDADDKDIFEHTEDVKPVKYRSEERLGKDKKTHVPAETGYETNRWPLEGKDPIEEFHETLMRENRHPLQVHHAFVPEVKPKSHDGIEEVFSDYDEAQAPNVTQPLNIPPKRKGTKHTKPELRSADDTRENREIEADIDAENARSDMRMMGHRRRRNAKEAEKKEEAERRKRFPDDFHQSDADDDEDSPIRGDRIAKPDQRRSSPAISPLSPRSRRIVDDRANVREERVRQKGPVVDEYDVSKEEENSTTRYKRRDELRKVGGREQEEAGGKTNTKDRNKMEFGHASRRGRNTLSDRANDDTEGTSAGDESSRDAKRDRGDRMDSGEIESSSKDRKAPRRRTSDEEDENETLVQDDRERSSRRRKANDERANQSDDDEVSTKVKPRKIDKENANPGFDMQNIKPDRSLRKGRKGDQPIQDDNTDSDEEDQSNVRTRRPEAGGSDQKAEEPYRNFRHNGRKTGAQTDSDDADEEDGANNQDSKTRQKGEETREAKRDMERDKAKAEESRRNEDEEMARRQQESIEKQKNKSKSSTHRDDDDDDDAHMRVYNTSRISWSPKVHFRSGWGILKNAPIWSSFSAIGFILYVEIARQLYSLLAISSGSLSAVTSAPSSGSGGSGGLTKRAVSVDDLGLDLQLTQTWFSNLFSTNGVESTSFFVFISLWNILCIPLLAYLIYSTLEKASNPHDKESTKSWLWRKIKNTIGSSAQVILVDRRLGGFRSFMKRFSLWTMIRSTIFICQLTGTILVFRQTMSLAYLSATGSTSSTFSNSGDVVSTITSLSEFASGLSNGQVFGITNFIFLLLLLNLSISWYTLLHSKKTEANGSRSILKWISICMITTTFIVCLLYFQEIANYLIQSQNTTNMEGSSGTIVLISANFMFMGLLPAMGYVVYELGKMWDRKFPNGFFNRTRGSGGSGGGNNSFCWIDCGPV